MLYDKEKSIFEGLTYNKDYADIRTSPYVGPSFKGRSRTAIIYRSQSIVFSRI